MLHELTRVVGGTKTSVVVDSIEAGGAVLTVVVLTFVNVGLAGGALEAQWTRATEKNVHGHCPHRFQVLLR